MMRSMYSAVSGLKTHQTKMDVIGNNIANVNTVAFKSSSVTFQDILYQTTAGASGANAATGLGGVNAKQIGLGVSMASTSVSIETAGAAETTGNPFDIKLTDKNSTNFFVVNDGSKNLFTRAGSFYVDGAGNLCMSSTGYTVMGWQVDPTTNQIRKDTVSALRIMQEKNLTSAPEATQNAVMAGILDENDTDVISDAGKVLNLNFYDNLGYQYIAKFAVKDTSVDGEYTVELTSILDSNNNDLVAGYDAARMSTLFGGSDLTEKITDTLNQASLESGYTLNADGSIIYAKSADYQVERVEKSVTVEIEGVVYTQNAEGAFVDGAGNLLSDLYETVTFNEETGEVTCETPAQDNKVDVSGEITIDVEGTKYTWDAENKVFKDTEGNELNTEEYNVSYNEDAKTVTYTVPAKSAAGTATTAENSITVVIDGVTYTQNADGEFADANGGLLSDLYETVTFNEETGEVTCATPEQEKSVDVSGEITIDVEGTEYTWDAENKVFKDADGNELDDEKYNVSYDENANTVTYTIPAKSADGTATIVENSITVEIDGIIYKMNEAGKFVSALDGTTTLSDAYTYNEAAGLLEYRERITYTFDEDTNTFIGDDAAKTEKTLKQMFGVSDVKMEALKSDPDFSIEFKGNAYIITEKSATYTLKFDTADGSFDSIDNDDAVILKLGDAVGDGNVNVNGNFANISIDFTQCLNYNNSGKSTISMDSGAVDGSTGKGRKLGNMIGVSIDTSGKIFGSYDNGNTELLGQIAVAQFSNASGLEKVGESCYQTTLNSGDFDGIGVEVSADGSSMVTGQLEMSNVDLSTEFTQMITTQRGFQANSRVITTSDTLLEELVNLKR